MDRNPQTRHASETLHETAADWLQRLDHPELKEEEIQAWLEWFGASDQNRKAFEELQALRRRLRELPDEYRHELKQRIRPEHLQTKTTSEDFRERLGLPLRPGDAPLFSSPTHVKGENRIARVFALAASVVLALTATVFIWKQNKQDAIATLKPVASLASKPGRILPAILPDGSKLDLGARSAIAIDFTGQQRQIEMEDGEAYFTVKPDKQKPFVVRAGPVSVTAVGTQFNVQKAGNRIVVTVSEGTVKVASGEGPNLPESASRPLLAPAGYQVIYDTTISAKPTMRAIDPTAATAWREGHLEYMSEPLSSVIATLNRYTEHSITLEDPTLARLNYTGTIEVKSVEEWIEALPRIFPVEIQAGPEDQVKIDRRH